MASAASTVPTQTPYIVFDSRKAGLISIVEEELPQDDPSPLSSASPQPPTWRKVDYFGKSDDRNVHGLGVTSAAGTSCPLTGSFAEISPNLGSSKNTLSGWGMIPPRQRTPSEINTSHKKSWNQGPQTLSQLSSVIPEISDDETSRQGSIVELEIYLRKASVVQSQPEKCDGTNADLLVTEGSDVLGPLHSPLTPLSPSIRTSASPRASSECLGRASTNDDQSAPTATTPKRPRLESRGVFKKFNNFADLHAFSFGQTPKARKESSTAPDPMSMEGGIQRPSSARTSLGSSVLHEAVQDVMLVNPITGERKMSAIRPTSAGQLARPGRLRRSSSATSMRTPSTASRPSLSARNSSTRSSFGIRSATSTHDAHSQTLSSIGGQQNRHASTSASTRQLTLSSSYARTMSGTRTMSSSTWSRTMSTFSRASSTASMTTYDAESARLENDPIQSDRVDAETGRESSFFVPLLGHFQWNKSDSAVALPTQESKPAYQEALADVEEDPDFVEVEIEPKAGSIGRRTSLLANIFTNKDIDVDPDLEFEPSTSEADIKQGIAKARGERSRRKMIYSRNVAVTSIAAVNALGVALSFGLFSVWYAVVPLILLAPLLRSAMVFNLLGNHAYVKARALLEPHENEEAAKVPIMDYATVVSFSNESSEDIQSTLDSVVDQKDVDMHKNLLLITCNDNVWNIDPTTKSTTRIILENILTSIVDEAKFQMPRNDQEPGFDTMWCRRGIYRGLPYVLMVKEGVTKKAEILDLTRNLLYAYNLRRESYFNPVPSVFFAWCKEWAELHDFASFDFLVNIAPDTLLEEHCISRLHMHSLKHPTCAGVLSRVEIDFCSSKWSPLNLFSNSQLMYDQVRHSHQTQIMHKASVDANSCQMIRICEETCGLQLLKDAKERRPAPMSNMVKQICSSLEEDDMTYGVPEINIMQAVRAVTYARSATTFSEFFAQRQRIAFSTCATDLAVICNSQMHWFERLSSAAELLAWCLPIVSLAVITNFLRSAALAQNIPVLIVLSAIFVSPWLYATITAMRLSQSWDARLRYVLGFGVLILTGPFVAIYVVFSTLLNLHRLRPKQPKRRRSSTRATQVQRSNV
ncbi:hypothetical protein M436DRAFT_69544 [Aureobasidium namibiae CBS 147.97]|uniref:Uncharacterized protein n=1 Tax=Aureobasidium namibiae CBS 147.97 TaxID=1043004 RepID=A0A074WTP3_9PEZI|nr:uncharacterized protein M436DRAFT_69544 [Aureobasidium namibiae CBS 147.97]KEQ76570.1 hypothetical protein M436DRAFT_69544 [Aureobasidium namibiae CBS 147.97]